MQTNKIKQNSTLSNMSANAAPANAAAALPHLQGWLRHWEAGLFRDGWKKRWLLLEAEKLFLFRGESELEHLEFIDLSAVNKVAPVENAFGTTQGDQFGFTIESATGKHFFLADDHKAMWFWVTGIVKWVNHIARAYKRSATTHRVDLTDRDAAAHDGKIELSHAVVKQLMRASGAEIGGAASSSVPPGKFIRSKSVSLRRSLGPDELEGVPNKAKAADAAAAAAAAGSPAAPAKGVRFAAPAAAAAVAAGGEIKAGPIETVMLRPTNETKLNETDADAAVEAMRDKVEHILSAIERINLSEARAILLAARAVDEEHNPTARSAAAAASAAGAAAPPKTPRSSGDAPLPVDVGAEPDEQVSDVEKLRARLAAAREQAREAEQREKAGERKVVEGERRRTIVARTWNERLVEMRRELELVAKARENDIARWRRRTFDALLLAAAAATEPPLPAGEADTLFQRLLSEVSPEADVQEWSEWLQKNRKQSDNDEQQ